MSNAIGPLTAFYFENHSSLLRSSRTTEKINVENVVRWSAFVVTQSSLIFCMQIFYDIKTSICKVIDSLMYLKIEVSEEMNFTYTEL